MAPKCVGAFVFCLSTLPDKAVSPGTRPRVRERERRGPWPGVAAERESGTGLPSGPCDAVSSARRETRAGVTRPAREPAVGSWGRASAGRGPGPDTPVRRLGLSTRALPVFLNTPTKGEAVSG